VTAATEAKTEGLVNKTEEEKEADDAAIVAAQKAANEAETLWIEEKATFDEI